MELLAKQHLSLFFGNSRTTKTGFQGKCCLDSKNAAPDAPVETNALETSKFPA
jgi:hypothetical protein